MLGSLATVLRSGLASATHLPAGGVLRAAQIASRSFSATPEQPAAPAAGAAPPQRPAPTAPAPAGHTEPTLVVFGGRGYVGSHVCREALKSGLHVVSITPSGTPPLGVREPWIQQVQWARGNALEPATYEALLPGALAAVSCVGGFGSAAEMLRTNGTANAAAIAASAAAGVPRFVLLSAHLPNVPGLDLLLGGYIQGKQQAEAELFRCYPSAGVALRPWVIYGDRPLSSAITLPLGALFGPVEALLKRLPPAQGRALAALPVVGAGFVPPVAVEQVARVAVAAATDPAVPGGVIDDWQIADWK